MALPAGFASGEEVEVFSPGSAIAVAMKIRSPQMIGVELPEGVRTIDLRFTSPAYERGKTITWLAIAIGFLMLGAGVWRDRRSLA